MHFKETPSITWINIDKVPPIMFLKELQLGFDLHPVVIEDILNLNQRPKIEILDDYIYTVLKMLRLDEEKKRIIPEQVSIVLSHKFLITFQQGVRGDTFQPVRDLIGKTGTRIRTQGTDYLCYELIDSVVANYFDILEHFSNKIEVLEKEIATRPNSKTLHSIYSLKRTILHFRKSVWPLREVISMLERGESQLIKKSTRIYLRDLYDQMVQIVDAIDTYRDILSGLLDLYLSNVSNRTNSIMKVLTIITTVFMPLSFMTGYYGMNFSHLPGLNSNIAPILLTAAMLFVFAGMLWFFKKKQWL